jgi:hypothetical protein
MGTSAGKGEHHIYRIKTSADDTKDKGLEAEKHYLGIDAVAWFINKESSWFSSRMASGTLDITLAGGLERYQAALGVFDLAGGAKTAPVFDRPILPDRRYRGGPIVVSASLSGAKKDTALSSMLKSAAGASLGVLSGMVQTATIVGPAKLLEAAGQDLVSGVKKVLSESAEKREPLFDFAGLELSIQPGELGHDETYFLFHRGTELNSNKLTVDRNGQLFVPVLGSQPLDDGAWLLLRFRKSTEYSGVREWFDVATRWRNKLAALVDDVGFKIVSKDAALKRLRPTTSGDQTLFDEYSQLRTMVITDGVLTEAEASTRAGLLRAALQATVNAVQSDAPRHLTAHLKVLRDELMSGKTPGGEAGVAFLDGAASVSAERDKLAPKENGKDVAASLRSRSQSKALSGAGITAEDWHLLPHVIEEGTTIQSSGAGGSER